MTDGSLRLIWRLLLEPNSLRTESNKLDSKLSEIRLSIQHPSNENKVFILLEGNTDIKLFRKFFTKDFTDTTGLDGKEKVIQALEILLQEGYTQIIGIKDADFDHLLNIHPSANLFITDMHDMEMQMLESSALDALLAEYRKTDIESHEIKAKIYPIALVIGCARFFDEKKKHAGEERDLCFDSLKFKNFVQRSNGQLVFNEAQFLSELLNESKKRKQSLDVTNDTLKAEIESIKSHSHDAKQICSGHDMTKLLGLVCLQNPNGEEMEKALRLAYQFTHFQETTLYANLCTWASQQNLKLFS